tara:strand:- start:228 stop:395 length:168 start_codon:yes stop_codon:yes gene_type:complete
MANFKQLPRVKQVSYGDYEVERLHQMEETIMSHHGKNFSQMHKDMVRKEYQLLSL